MEQPQHLLKAQTAAAAKSPARRFITIGLVALLHIGLIWAFAVGLVAKMADRLPEVIKAEVVEEKTPDQPPPPPPPDLAKPPPPVVPPPDIVIQAEAPPTNTIQATTQKPPPVAKNPMEGVSSPARSRGQNCLTDFYPALSLRMHEEGTTKLSFNIGVDGKPTDIKVASSSGKPRLDEASINCAKTWRYTPAQKDGQPMEWPNWTTDVKWQISG